MRGDPSEFHVLTPQSVPEALELLAANAGAPLKPLAGGTDLMVLLELGKLTHRRLISLHALSELRGIQSTDTHLTIGATTTFTQLQAHPLVREEVPLLRDAARSIGALAIQNRGTIGGNIANASPAADSSPALLVYDAEVELISKKGARRVPYSLFHTGYKTLDLLPDELIASISIPRKWKGATQVFRKVGARAAQAISKVCFAGLIQKSNGVVSECRIALGSVASVSMRCKNVETIVSGSPLDAAAIKAAKAALIREIAPIDDIRSNKEYRMRVSLNLLEDFLISARK